MLKCAVYVLKLATVVPLNVANTTATTANAVPNPAVVVQSLVVKWRLHK
jgi:hypothetical protein